MAGLGGFMGYGLGGINWDATSIGVALGGHVQVTFTIITVIFIICVSYTITSFKEIPLYLLQNHEQQIKQSQMVWICLLLILNFKNPTNVIKKLYSSSLFFFFADS